MKKSKWPDFLFTIAVRFVCGTALGGLASLLGGRAILRAFSRDHTQGPFIWMGLCGLAGGIIAVFTVPRWQTPWYKREALDLGPELVSPGQDAVEPGANVVKKSVSIKTVGEDGEQHEYSSMEEAPSEIRAEIEALEKEAAQDKGNELSVTETSQTGDAVTSKSIYRKNVSVYKIVDESGVERTYHSLKEMPPEIRAAIAEAEEKSKTS